MSSATPPTVKRVHLDSIFDGRFLTDVFKKERRGATAAPRIHFETLPGAFNQQVVRVVKEYLNPLEGMHLDESEGSGASGKTAVTVLDERLSVFFAETPVLYKALKEVFQIPAAVERKMDVLQFLRINFTDLENLFTWARNNHKTATEDRFLLDCLLLDGFKDNFYKTSILKRRGAAKIKAVKTRSSQRKTTCVKKELLQRLFLHSIQIPGGADITTRLLETVTSLEVLKAGLMTAIEYDKAALAKNICVEFIEQLACLPRLEQQQHVAFLAAVLEEIKDQKTYQCSYQVWSGSEKIIKAKQAELEESFLEDVEAATKRAVEEDETTTEEAPSPASSGSLGSVRTSPSLGKNASGGLAALAGSFGSLALADDELTSAKRRCRRANAYDSSDDES